MKIELRDAADLLKKYRRFVITAHVNPDGDAVGSVLALSHILIGMGKETVCLIDDEVPQSFQFMPGYETIARPDQKVENADLLIILDASDLKRIGKVKDVVDAPILNIDHHMSNDDFADYMYLDSDRAATGEIIYQLIELMRAEMNRSVAICLYTAIATDCGFFRFANTTSFTMQCAAKCIDYGARPNLVSEELEKKSLAAIRSLSSVLNSIEIFCEGRISCITITTAMLDGCESTEGFIDFARVIRGVDLAVMVKYRDESSCRVSMRSKSIDVSAIAAKFGGGGHMRAAGCTICEPIPEAKRLILTAAQEAVETKRHA